MLSNVSPNILCMSSHCRDRHLLSKINCPPGQHRGNTGFFSTAAQIPPEKSSEQALLCPFLHRQTGMEGTPTPPVDRGQWGLHHQFLQLSRTHSLSVQYPVSSQTPHLAEQSLLL